MSTNVSRLRCDMTAMSVDYNMMTASKGGKLLGDDSGLQCWKTTPGLECTKTTTGQASTVSVPLHALKKDLQIC